MSRVKVVLTMLGGCERLHVIECGPSRALKSKDLPSTTVWSQVTELLVERVGRRRMRVGRRVGCCRIRMVDAGGKKGRMG